MGVTTIGERSSGWPKNDRLIEVDLHFFSRTISGLLLLTA